jgi:hypothetical protein
MTRKDSFKYHFSFRSHDRSVLPASNEQGGHMQDALIDVNVDSHMAQRRSDIRRATCLPTRLRRRNRRLEISSC